jgi:decaprenylphospho-beta-D-ribofuranose 2-oxidase
VGRALDPVVAVPEAAGVTRLPTERLEWVPGWGEAVGAAGYVWRPSTVAGVLECLAEARRRGVPVVLRGAGRSYGDAALRAEAVVLDLSRMRRVLAWSPARGVVDVEPGVTVSGLWRYVIGDGWWPPVVTGTAQTSIGGCLAMNVHGKNNWARGTLADHCTEIDVVLPSGELKTIEPQRDADLFRAVVGGFGMLGVIVRARLQMKQVHSGLVEVHAVAAPDLASIIRLADDAKDRWEYVVAWIDCFPGGRRLGRGLLHFARHLEAGEDPAPAQSLRVTSQDLPDTFFGVMPKSAMWRFIKPFSNRPGMRLINLAKYVAGATVGHDARYRQSLAGFQFLLDYVPHWNRIYEPGGMIQFQSFVPVADAERVFRQQLELARERRLESFLGVLKRHRPDDYLLSHTVDGFSLALDFPVRSRRREDLWRLVADMAAPVVEAGGRFYPAKDAALPGELWRASFTEGQVERFCELKRELDPDGVLRSSLADRFLPPEPWP